MALMGYKQIIVVDTQANLPSNADAGDIAYAKDVKLNFTFDGNTWNPNSRILVKKGVANVNCKTSGTTLIYTLEQSSYNFVPLFIHVKAINISGLVLSPSVSIGTNATNYDDVLSVTALDSLLSATGLVKTYNAAQTKAIPSLTGGTQIYAKVPTLNLATATNYMVRFDIMGYYEQP